MKFLNLSTRHLCTLFYFTTSHLSEHKYFAEPTNFSKGYYVLDWICNMHREENYGGKLKVVNKDNKIIKSTRVVW